MAEEDRITLLTGNGKLVAVNQDGALNVSEASAGAPTDLWTLEVTENSLEEAVKAAREAEAAIVFVGNNPLM